jgi:hypothetical protein
METLTTHATQGSTYAIPVSFKDENDQAVTPNAAEWYLYDLDGNIINDREAIEIETPSTTNTIVLTGDDLPAGTLRVLVLFTYDSDLGDDLPARVEIEFTVDATISDAVISEEEAP